MPRAFKAQVIATQRVRQPEVGLPLAHKVRQTKACRKGISNARTTLSSLLLLVFLVEPGDLVHRRVGLRLPVFHRADRFLVVCRAAPGLLPRTAASCHPIAGVTRRLPGLSPCHQEELRRPTQIAPSQLLQSPAPDQGGYGEKPMRPQRAEPLPLW